MLVTSNARVRRLLHLSDNQHTPTPANSRDNRRSSRLGLRHARAFERLDDTESQHNSQRNLASSGPNASSGSGIELSDLSTAASANKTAEESEVTVPREEAMSFREMLGQLEAERGQMARR